EHSEKTGEYLEGIARVWEQPDLPEELLPYMQVVRRLNENGRLRYYPGSPLLAKHLLREHDKLILTELHPSDYPLLRTEFSRDERATVAR
ncbi:23S rRNA (adenine(2030)-N(6))-methyltransferase RlmJ, partial [Bacillus safensis]